MNTKIILILNYFYSWKGRKECDSRSHFFFQAGLLARAWGYNIMTLLGSFNSLHNPLFPNRQQQQKN